MRRFGHLRAAVAAVAVSAALVAATTIGAGGASASAVARAPQATTGGVIKFAESPGASPNFILPLTTSATQSLYNIYQFINLMWPLIYLPTPNEPTLDYAHSMAYAPVWSDNDTVATVTLKHYMWSDGVPVTARDVVFFYNEVRAMGPTWGGYGGPTQFPFNVKTCTATSATTVKFVLTAPINPTFFDDNGIDDMYVIPQHAWDKTSVTGAIGNYDETASGAKAVLAFLTKEAEDSTTYSTNPLWKVIDGPWELQSFGGDSSPDVFVPNPTYSGPKPTASEFEEIPFTSDSAVFTALKAGPSTLDYGAIPTQDIPTIPSIKSEGYNVTPVPTWGFDFMMPNFANPAVGPVLNQLYIRQVFGHLMDQNTMIKHFMDGYGTPVYGPAPIYPLGNPFVTNAEKTNPYPYSVSTAESILKAHGWKVDPGGVDTCQTPGAGPSDCGAGITAGEKLSINLLWASGLEISQEIVDLFQSDAAQAGVQINPKSGTFNSVLSVATPCVLPKGKGTPACNWQLVFWGGIGLSTYPSGEGVFNTGGGLNVGSYSNPTLDKYINESTVASTLSAFDQYENLIVQQAVWVWVPIPDNIFATAKNLTGYGLTSEFCGGFNYIEPQFWSITS
ncbi:MAG: ABC transporter substrate-binding protein [Acidimicrobiales bacterium]